MSLTAKTWAAESGHWYTRDGVPEARCANVFISRDTPGLVVIHEWAEGDILKGWSMFLRLLEFWQIKNNHE